MHILRLDRPGTDILNELQRAGKVFILDAVLTPTHQDQLLCMAPEEFPKSVQDVSSHQVGLADALQLAVTLGQDLAHVSILGIPLDPSANALSREVNLPRLREALKACILGP
jgi:Ni,Fe-hydrogenase maturation factor